VTTLKITGTSNTGGSVENTSHPHTNGRSRSL